MYTGLYITDNRGATLAIHLKNPNQHGIYIENIEGLGYPQTNITSKKFINYDVAVYKYAETDQRNIVITFGLLGNPSVEVSRHLLYDFLPMRYPLILEFATDERCGFTRGYIETIEPDIFKEREVVQVSIVCLDPYFYAGGSKKLINQFEYEPLFNFGENWFTDGVKPISRSLKKNLKLVYNSRFQNPPDFSLIIHARSGGFDEATVTYEGGSVQVNFSYSDDNDYDDEQPEMSNFFKQYDDLVIKSDLTGNGVYKRDGSSGLMYEITNLCIITGDMPNLRSGINTFEATTLGVTTGISSVEYKKNGLSEYYDNFQNPPWLWENGGEYFGANGGGQLCISYYKDVGWAWLDHGIWLYFTRSFDQLDIYFFYASSKIYEDKDNGGKIVRYLGRRNIAKIILTPNDSNPGTSKNDHVYLTLNKTHKSFGDLTWTIDFNPFHSGTIKENKYALTAIGSFTYPNPETFSIDVIIYTSWEDFANAISRTDDSRKKLPNNHFPINDKLVMQVIYKTKTTHSDPTQVSVYGNTDDNCSISLEFSDIYEAI